MIMAVLHGQQLIVLSKASTTKSLAIVGWRKTFSKGMVLSLIHIFGLSRPENNKGIIYRAAAQEMFEGEAEKLNCETLIIPKGKYIAIVVNEYSKDILSIDRAFRQLLKQTNLDPQGYCVEQYATDIEAVTCMIRLNE